MSYKSLETVGVGINYRNEIGPDIIPYLDMLDCIEVYTEKFFIQDYDKIFKKIIDTLPLTLHGLDLSIGSINDIDPHYLDKLTDTLKKVNHLWFSEHISLTQEEGVEVGHLMPIQFSKTVADRIIHKIKILKQLSDKPFLLENITYYYKIPGSTMTEAEFIRYILDTADCGMLLDVNNLYLNAKNHHYDPYQFLSALPLDRVVQLHMAGGSKKFGMLIDTHATPIWPDVWALCDYVVKMTPVRCIIIERDSNLPVFTDLIKEVETAKDILARHGKLAYA